VKRRRGVSEKDEPRKIFFSTNRERKDKTEGKNNVGERECLTGRISLSLCAYLRIQCARKGVKKTEILRLD
jgi:hypothetical protein